MKNITVSLFIFLCMSASVTFANVGPVTIIGKQIELNDSTEIVLENERVEILLSPMSAEVVCDFYLKNTGNTEVLPLAFPGGAAQKWEDEEDIHYYETKDFMVYVNNQEVNVSYHKGDHITGWYGWYRWKSQFPTGGEVHIRISYTALNHNYGFTYNPYGDFSYILSTGSPWKDSIGSVDIIVRLKDMDICQVTDFAPQNGKVNLDKSITWHFEDFEPDQHSNITIWYEIELFNPIPRATASLGSDYLNSGKIQETLMRLDFEAFQATINHAAKSESEEYNERYDWVSKIILRNVLDDILRAGNLLQKQGEWNKAIQLYRWYKETYGDIRSDLRPYSILYFRLAECYKHINDKITAISAFNASMDWEAMNEDRYFRGLRNMYDADAQIKQKSIPFRSEKSEQLKHYFYSKGLNEYCKVNIRALSNN